MRSVMRLVVAGACCLALAGAARAGWVVAISENFESGSISAGWTAFRKGAYAKEYTWGAVAHNSPPQGTYCGWCAAGGADGLDPSSSNYPVWCESWLATTDWIDISDSDDVVVDVYLWVACTSPNDRFWVGVSTDGTTYEPALLVETGAYYASGDFGSAGWIQEHADLSDVQTLGDVAGTATQVKIALVFESDGSADALDGAYVDWINVAKDVETVEIPCGQAPSENAPGAALAAVLFAAGLLALRRKAAFARA